MSDVSKQIEELLEQASKPLSFEEACQYLNCSASHLYKLTHKRRIPFYKPQGKKIFFDRQQLRSWLLQNPVKTAQQIEQQAINHVALGKAVAR